MAYTNKVSGFVPTGTVQSVTTAGPTDIATFLATNQLVVKKVAFKVKTAMTVAAAVISVYKRAKPSQTSGQVLITTLTIPLAATCAIDSVVYKSITGYTIPEGNELAFVCTTAATAGDGWCFFSEVEDSPETEANGTLRQASA